MKKKYLQLPLFPSSYFLLLHPFGRARLGSQPQWEVNAVSVVGPPGPQVGAQREARSEDEEANRDPLLEVSERNGSHGY